MAAQYSYDYIHTNKQVEDLIYQYRLLNKFRRPDYLVLHSETLKAICGGFGLGMVPRMLAGTSYTVCDDLPFGRVMVCEI